MGKAGNKGASAVSFLGPYMPLAIECKGSLTYPSSREVSHSDHPTVPGRSTNVTLGMMVSRADLYDSQVHTRNTLFST